MSTLSCYTAPGKLFTDREELLAHYKTEWHAYNLKRKVKNLSPISEDLFNQVKQRIDQQRQHLDKSKAYKKRDHIKKQRKNDIRASVNILNKNLVSREDINLTDDSSNFTSDSSLAGKDESDDEVFLDLDEAEKPINFCQSMFEIDDKPVIFNTTDENLTYMQQKFGFFLPCIESLVDLEGLLTYCSQKIRVGKFCLFCDRRFSSNNAVIQHMVSKNHCKLNWGSVDKPDEDEDENFDEFAEFYDFSAENDVKSKQGKVAVNMLETGEVLLTYENGEKRILGNKIYRKYYNQYNREHSTAISATANRREQKERLEKLLKKVSRKDASTELIQSDREKTGVLSNSIFKIMDKIQRKKLVKSQKRKVYEQSKLRLRDGLQQNLVVRNKTTGKLDVSNC